MTLGPYMPFIVAAFLVVTMTVAMLIAWIMLDDRIQMRRLRELDQSGVARPSGRSATDAT